MCHSTISFIRMYEKYDLLGKVVANTNINTLSGTASMATSHLAQGTYIYSITSSNLGQLNNGRFVVVK